jgi:hypothetical protein
MSNIGFLVCFGVSDSLVTHVRFCWAHFQNSVAGRWIRSVKNSERGHIPFLAIVVNDLHYITDISSFHLCHVNRADTSKL